MNQTRHAFHKVTIPSGSNISNSIQIFGESVVGLRFETALDSETVSILSARVPTDDYVNVCDPSDGSDRTISAAGGVCEVSINPADYSSVQNLKLESSSNESADREIYVYTRPIA